jgi:hypothetical protein
MLLKKITTQFNICFSIDFVGYDRVFVENEIFLSRYWNYICV